MIVGNISTCNLSRAVGNCANIGGDGIARGASFIYFIAVLSTCSGVADLFPIPAFGWGASGVLCLWRPVDGGKPPSDGALRVADDHWFWNTGAWADVFALGN